MNNKSLSCFVSILIMFSMSFSNSFARDPVFDKKPPGTDVKQFPNPVSGLSYQAYRAYFAAIGSGATKRYLPGYVRTKLSKHFDSSLLNSVRYASSNHIDAAMTDCKTIYFPSGSDVVRAIKNGKLFGSTNKSKLCWFLHELSHSRQCVAKGGRSKYGKMWFSQLGVTVLTELISNPTGISAKSIHDNMPMERAAESNGNRICQMITNPYVETRKKCTSSSQCPSNLICRSGFCQKSNFCSSKHPCVNRQICYQNRCVTRGSPCNKITDCAKGQFCIDNSCISPPIECNTSKSKYCSDGALCINNLCMEY